MIQKPKLISEFLEICSKRNFLDGKIRDKTIENINLLSNGKLLRENINREVHGQQNKFEKSVKLFSENIINNGKTNLSLAEKFALTRRRFPFGIIEQIREENVNKIWQSLVCNDENDLSMKLPDESNALRTTYFVHKKHASEHFYRIQRQCKIWWMKFAANPGRFHISEVRKDENDTSVQSVTLKAIYEFGNFPIEHVELITRDTNEMQDQLPSILIQSKTYLEAATLHFLFDAIDGGDYGEMCLHRSIAPHQMALYCVTEESSSQKKLKYFLKFVQDIIEKENIRVIANDDCQTLDHKSLDTKFHQMDTIGIPFGIILDSASLENGLVKLRNRDTTLCEVVHISSLSEYLSKIFH